VFEGMALMAGSEDRQYSDGCAGEDTILAFLIGQLDGEKLAHIEGHLDSCGNCRRVVVAAAAHVRSSATRILFSSASPERCHSAPQRSGSSVLFADSTQAGDLLTDLRTVDDQDYRVERELARGGMGRVLLALDRQGRRVALKVLLHSTAQATERFLRELHITARLQHPSIITLHEAGRWRSGEPFFAMKLIEGRSLRDELASLSGLAERLSLLPIAFASLDRGY
jgi:hypothetical protein